MFFFFFLEMDCTLCYLRFSVIPELKKHYVDFHGVDEKTSHVSKNKKTLS